MTYLSEEKTASELSETINKKITEYMSYITVRYIEKQRRMIMFTTRSMQLVFMFAMATVLSLSLPINLALAYSCPGTDAETICNDNPLANCDSDLDGYSDAEECNGITLPYGAQESDSGSVTYKYGATDPDLMMNPMKQDLYL